VIKAGTKKVDIVFETPYIAQPVVLADIALEDDNDPQYNTTDEQADEFFNQNIQTLITNKTQNGFTIRINKTSDKDIRFSWNALQVKDPSIFESVLPGLVVDPDPNAANNPDPNITPDPNIIPDPTITPDTSISPDPNIVPDPTITPDPNTTIVLDPNSTSSPTVTPDPNSSATINLTP
jgi:hypothetical protein